MKDATFNNYDSSSPAQLKKYAEDLSTLYKAEKKRGKALHSTNRQLMEYAEALNRTIAELKGRNEMLGALALELSAVEEHERSKIAEDIHDHIGQILAMAKVQLQELSKSALSIDTAGLHEIEGSVQQAISYSRSLMFEISPNALLELGFVEAIDWLVEHIHNKYGMDINYSHCEQANPMDGNASTILFKAVRELLINTLKHAKTNKAFVSVENNGDGVRVRVCDEGVGFDPSEIRPFGTGQINFGLFNLQQRITNSGGSIDIDSVQGRGTRVQITLPKNMPVPA